MKCALPLLFAALLLPLAGRAETQCPWVNEATVAGSQDIPVRLEVQTLAGSGSCLFQYHLGEAGYQLRVTVRETSNSASFLRRSESQCASGMTRLNGIGNEAILCRVKSGPSFAEQVAGRVRNQMFVIRASANHTRDNTMTKKIVRKQAYVVAEQVTGNLF